MIYYAFKNRCNGKLISGTDYRTNPYRQILADEYRRPLILNKSQIETEMRIRNINPKTYKIVEVEVTEFFKSE